MTTDADCDRGDEMYDAMKDRVALAMRDHCEQCGAPWVESRFNSGSPTCRRCGAPWPMEGER